MMLLVIMILVILLQQPGQQNTGQNQQRQTLWQGVLEWIEKAKNPNDTQKVTRHVPCQVSANPRDGEPDL
jgi:mediator of RNA polymerase II transcription subunit 25